MEKRLRFREDGSFRILQLTDIHYTEDDERDHRTVALMRLSATYRSRLW